MAKISLSVKVPYINHQQLLDQVSSILIDLRDIIGDRVFGTLDLLEKDTLITVTKRGLAHEHFVDQTPEGSEINHFSVALV